MKRYLTLRNLIAVVIAGAVGGFAVFWIVTIPATVPASALPQYTPNADNGKTMFNIGGCSSCHATPNKDPQKVDRLQLGGGLELPCPFGTFVVPNISPDSTDGIGNWSEADFVTALWDGTAPDGTHLYPAFPYGSYRHMELSDVRDLFAYLKTLPPVKGRPTGHDLEFPFNIRRLLGGWKFLYLTGGPFQPDPTKSAQWNRGAYLVNGPGHCAECHSPRNVMGGIIGSERFAGGPTPDGKSWVPNITPAGLGHWGSDKIAWTQKDIASFLSDGMNPSGDYAGGSMAEVVENTSLLGPDDRAAIAAYIASLPPTQGPPPATEEIDRVNTGKGIVLKLVSAVLFAVMSALIRYLGARYPIGEVVFYRSAFALVPVMLIYAVRGELMEAVRTGNPLGQASRGALSIVGMFCNFGALARLPLIEANAISFTSPLISVALAALVLKERVRIYRWSAVTIGFIGVLVVLAPHLSGDELTIAMASATSLAGVIYAVAGSVTNAGTMIQTRHLTKSETTSSIVFYFSLICALSGLVTLPFGWITPTSSELAVLAAIGFLGGMGHILLTESYRYAAASVVAPFDYTSMVWALLLGYAMFGEKPTVMIVVGSTIIAAAGLFVIWRERQLALERRRAVEGTTTSLQTP